MPNEISSLESNTQSEKIIKAVVAFEELGEEEKGAFLSEITKTNGGISDKLKLFLTKTKTRLNAIINKKKGFTEVKLSDDKAHQILDHNINPLTPINITITSAEEYEDEIRTQIHELSSTISKRFEVDEFAFIEIFHDFFPDFYYFLFTNEPINFGNFFPEGFHLEDSESERVASSYEAYTLNNSSPHEVITVHDKLVKIFAKQFPLREEARIREFINKTRLPVLILSYKSVIQDNNKKFN